MLQQTKQADSELKRIDQIFEDYAGEEIDDSDYNYNHSNYLLHQKHYCAEENAMLDIDDLY